MAWFAMIAVPVVLFTFAGVNTLLPGLHSYG
jgi:ABC-type transport system involved in cytochrome c biogenesis permease subunit